MAVKKRAAGSKKSASASAATSAAPAAGLVNHIAFVVDRSGSMRSIKAQVVRVFNNQLDTVQNNAKSAGQKTFLSTFMFHNTVDKPRNLATPVERVPKLAPADFKLGGATALLDAVGTAIDRLQQAKGAKDKNTSFLVVVITDGEENASRRYKTSLKGLIAKVQKTGRWSLAFLVPPGGERYLTRFGIPKGNITVWDATAKGAKVMDVKLASGLSSFYAARASGKQSVTAFFTTDMSKVDQKRLTTLKDMSKGFARWTVDKERSIREFVDAKLQGSPGAAQEAGGRVRGGPRLLRADQAGDGAGAEDDRHHEQEDEGDLRRGPGAPGAGHADRHQREGEAGQPPRLRHLRREHLHQPEAGARHDAAVPPVARGGGSAAERLERLLEAALQHRVLGTRERLLQEVDELGLLVVRDLGRDGREEVAGVGAVVLILRGERREEHVPQLGIGRAELDRLLRDAVLRHRILGRGQERLHGRGVGRGVVDEIGDGHLLLGLGQLGLGPRERLVRELAQALAERISRPSSVLAAAFLYSATSASNVAWPPDSPAAS